MVKSFPRTGQPVSRPIPASQVSSPGPRFISWLFLVCFVSAPELTAQGGLYNQTDRDFAVGSLIGHLNGKKKFCCYGICSNFLLLASKNFNFIQCHRTSILQGKGPFQSVDEAQEMPSSVLSLTILSSFPKLWGKCCCCTIFAESFSQNYDKPFRKFLGGKGKIAKA